MLEYIDPILIKELLDLLEAAGISSAEALENSLLVGQKVAGVAIELAEVTEDILVTWWNRDILQMIELQMIESLSVREALIGKFNEVCASAHSQLDLASECKVEHIAHDDESVR